MARELGERIVLVGDTLPPRLVVDALAEVGLIVDYKTEEDNTMFNRRIALGSALAMSLGLLSQGAQALTDVAAGNSALRSFSQRYGNNPKSLNGSYRCNSNAAKQKRAARKLRNIRAKSSKRA